MSIESKSTKTDGVVYLYRCSSSSLPSLLLRSWLRMVAARALVRTHKGDDRLLVPIPSKNLSKKKLIEYLKNLYPGTCSLRLLLLSN